ncbi:MAG: hypothetical protein IJV50_07130 [Lachnospiraceae bacterium]|nr:hypothetical protein [Lachnospiraceae bacterium]
MKTSKILLLTTAIVMLIAGVLTIWYQFSGNPIHMVIAGIGYVAAGILLISYHVFEKKQS